MTESFESLELAPWIIRQTAKLGINRQTIFFFCLRMKTVCWMYLLILTLFDFAKL